MTAPLEPLGAQDLPALRALLTREPANNLYLLGLLEELGIAPKNGGAPFALYGQPAGTGLSAAVFVGGGGGLVVPSTSSTADLRPLLAQLAGVVKPVTVLGEKIAVEAVLRQLGPSTPAVNHAQRLFAVSADDLGPFTNPTLRLAEESDLPRLLPLAAGAVTEFFGKAALERDPAGLEERVLRRVRARRTYVLEHDGLLVFKIDVGSRSEHGAELEGLYTLPEHRRRGHATLSLGQISRHLLSSLPRLAMRIDERDVALAGVARKVGFIGGRAHRLVMGTAP